MTQASVTTFKAGASRWSNRGMRELQERLIIPPASLALVGALCEIMHDWGTIGRRKFRKWGDMDPTHSVKLTST
jgi:hypothetical protein